MLLKATINNKILITLCGLLNKDGHKFLVIPPNEKETNSYTEFRCL